MDIVTSQVNHTTSSVPNTTVDYVEILKEKPTLFAAIVVTILAGILGLLYLICWKGRSSNVQKNALLIVGPTGAGKTSLFFKLTGKDWKGTVTSIVPNIGHAKIGATLETSLRIVDLPGSPCLSYFMQKHIKSAVMVIFVVDGADFLNDILDTAEYDVPKCIDKCNIFVFRKMWKLLEDTAFKKHPVPILIAVNKSDLGAKCHTERFICTRLQKEIDSIRKQQPSLAQDVGVFTFDRLKTEVAIAKISVKLSELTPLHDFISKHKK